MAYIINCIYWMNAIDEVGVYIYIYHILDIFVEISSNNTAQ